MALTTVCDVCGTDLRDDKRVSLDTDTPFRFVGGTMMLAEDDIPWPREDTDVDLCEWCAEEHGVIDALQSLGEYFKENPPDPPR